MHIIACNCHVITCHYMTSAKWGVHIYAEYAEYRQWTILHVDLSNCILFCKLQHIILHITLHIMLHIMLHTTSYYFAYIYAPICKIICKIIVHCLYSAYSAYCYMQYMQNMHINMQKYVNEYAVICIYMPNNMQNNSSLSI